MGILDAPIGAVSAALIEKFGKAVTLRTPGGTYDVATGAVTGAPMDKGVRALVEDYPAFQSMGGSAETDAGVRRGDKKVTVAAKALPAEPVPTQSVIINGKAYGILKVDAVYSGDEAALYVLQCRR